MGEDTLNLDEVMSQSASDDLNPQLDGQHHQHLKNPRATALANLEEDEISPYDQPSRGRMNTNTTATNENGIRLGTEDPATEVDSGELARRIQTTNTTTNTPQRRAPSVTVYAQKEALRGAIGQQAKNNNNNNNSSNASIKSNGLLSKFLQKRQHKKVLVEGVPLGTKDSVFFAPDDYVMDGQQVRGTPTSFVNINPRLSPYTVHRGDAFEISFQGVSVSNNAFRDGSNYSNITTPELLLYSLTRSNDPLAPGSEMYASNPSFNFQSNNNNTSNINNANQQNIPSPDSTISNTNTNSTMNTNDQINESKMRNNQMNQMNQMHPRTVSANAAYSIPSNHIPSSLITQRALSMTTPGTLSSLVKQHMVNGRIDHVEVPTGISATQGDVPFIHYDPVIDGHDNGTDSDNYMPVPATKALYLRCTGKKNSNHNNSTITTTTTTSTNTTNEAVTDDEDSTILPQSVSIRFTIMEIDKVSDVQARAISGVDQLGNYVSHGSESVPYLELLTRAFAVASSLGNRGLKKYERPDHIHSVDMEFLLAERDEMTGKTSEKGPNCGNYLQYGYYFFLSEKVDARLYAQTCSSSQSIPLLLKREGFTRKMESKNEKEYFPLNGISYLVAKVTRGCKHLDNENIPSLRMDHKRRLDNMLQMSHVIDMLAAMNGNSKASINGARAIRR